MTIELLRAEWAGFRAEFETRFSAFKSEVADIQGKHHAENRVRLQAIDRQSVENGVKLDKLYGSDGQPGAVDRLGDRLGELTKTIAYASGFVAAVLLGVGWAVMYYIAHHGK